MPEVTVHKKRNKMLESHEGETSTFAALEKDFKELKHRLFLAHDRQQTHMQNQERHLQTSMVSLGDRINNLASNMKFQTASISRSQAEHERRLDTLCEGITSLENGICGELKELRDTWDSQADHTDHTDHADHTSKDTQGSGSTRSKGRQTWTGRGYQNW